MAFATINGAVVVNAFNSNQFAYLIRQDLNTVAVLDILTPNISVDWAGYRCHVAGATAEDSSKKYRLVRVTCYGVGIVTGGNIYFTANNGITEAYPYNPQTANPIEGILWVQGSNNLNFIWADATFVWQGIGVVPSRMFFEYSEIR